MLHTGFEFLQPLLTDVLAATALAILGLIARYIPAVARLYRDTQNRDALHRAIDTGVDYAFAVTEAAARGVPGVGAIDTALTYVERSVPGALRHFFGQNAIAARDHVRKMVIAKIKAKSGDALTEALVAAGAAAGPAVEAIVGAAQG